jgi:hypothetical protein
MTDQQLTFSYHNYEMQPWLPNAHSSRTEKAVTWVYLTLSLCAHVIHLMGCPIIFEFGAKIAPARPLTPRSKQKYNLSSQLSSTLPSFEPQQRNRILLLCCLPLLSLVCQILYCLGINYNHLLARSQR